DRFGGGMHRVDAVSVRAQFAKGHVPELAPASRCAHQRERRRPDECVYGRPLIGHVTPRYSPSPRLTSWIDCRYSTRFVIRISTVVWSAPRPWKIAPHTGMPDGPAWLDTAPCPCRITSDTRSRGKTPPL